jgi:hypothetical protein
MEDEDNISTPTVKSFRKRISNIDIYEKRRSIIENRLKETNSSNFRNQSKEKQKTASSKDTIPIKKLSTTPVSPNKPIKTGLELTMQQTLSIAIRKLRYGFIPQKPILISSSKTIKKLMYLFLREEISLKVQKVERYNTNDKISFLGIVPKTRDYTEYKFDEKFDMFTTEQQIEFFEDDDWQESQGGTDRLSNFMVANNDIKNSSKNLFKIGKKDFIKIDGINYGYKHVSNSQDFTISLLRSLRMIKMCHC